MLDKTLNLQVCGFNGREYTYEMAYSMIKKFGSGLLRMGAKKGDVLGMVVPNFPEFPIAFFGAAGVGVTVTTMNPTYRPGMRLHYHFELQEINGINRCFYVRHSMC